MKILAISGSPRKGNTYSVLKSLREHYPEIDLEILMLKDLDFELCRGCYSCVVRGEEKCPLDDDRERLVEKIQNADGLVLATPVYSHMVPALMKNLFDRLGYVAHRPQFFNKFAMSVATFSGYGAEPALEYMDKMLRAFGFNAAPSAALQYRPVRDTKAQEEANTRRVIAVFEVLLDRIRKGSRDKPTLSRLIPFGIFRAISMVARETMPADFEYYKDKSDYFYDVKLPFLTKWIAGRVVRKEVSRML